MQILWLKRDLRLHDHEALRQALLNAASAGPVLAVYLHEPALIAQPDFTAQHSGFIRETLDELHAEIEALGGSLCELVGDAPDAFATLHAFAPFTTIWAHQETGHADSFARDKAVAAWCEANGITLREVEQNGVRRGAERTRRPFNFAAHVEDSFEQNLFSPSSEAQFARSPFPRPPLDTIPQGAGTDKPKRLKGGRSRALRLLRRFMTEETLLAYPGAISSPNTAAGGCSLLSVYLSFGVVSDREVIQALNALMQTRMPRVGQRQQQRLAHAAQFYIDRLGWRAGYLQTFERKMLVEFDSDIEAFRGDREADWDRAALEAWKRGATGFPFIDAAMRMLAQTGWINMRLRGTVTSFALNELWLPIREVGLHLAGEFLDYEPAIHWYQLSIHSGSSKHATPLMYNPIKQARDHDAQGEFVRKWVPELREVPLGYLFEPWTMPVSFQREVGCVIGEHYPAPIIEHRSAAVWAKERVFALRGEGEAREKQQEAGKAKQEDLF